MTSIFNTIYKLTLSFIVISLTIPSIYAQEDSGVTLFSTPPSKGDKINLKPGEVYQDKFTVANLGTHPTTFYIYVSSFEQIEDYPGTSVPLSERDDQLDPYSASSWIYLPLTTITLHPQVNEEIPFTITVPSNPALGEYTVKIFLSTDNEIVPGEGSSATTNLGTGPAILIQVGDPADLIETADLLMFTTEKLFYEQPPVRLLTEIENTGNTHISPSGEIVLTNMFGKEVGRLLFNTSELSTIRGETAVYNTDWAVSRPIWTVEGQLIVGPIKAELIAQYRTIDPGFNLLTSETTFWIIPWKLILAIIAAVALIIIGFKVKRGRKK